jgi:pimeloyl-ACP methyl ester carboxylesterase
MSDMPPFFPIIYVRGFAFSDREVEETTDDPTNGFNIGSTHARQGPGEDPVHFQFPGPFVRLITDYGYTDVMRSGRDSLAEVEKKRQTLWIHRYYEPYSDTFGKHGKRGRPSIEGAAEELGNLIKGIRQDCFDHSDLDKRVILIAHSMGGLVCRSLIQRILTEDPATVIEKVVTYGTPHGGIPTATDWFSYHGAANFTRKGLFECLAERGTKDSKKFDPQELKRFPTNRFLCVIGTDYADYDAVSGWSRRIVGAGSDGLVLIERAWVRDAPRVYVHRSHSGRYGLVSSSEAFHAVERFLFGDLSLKLAIDDGDHHGPPPRPKPNIGIDGQALDFTISFVDADCTVGQQSLRVTQRRAEEMSAVRLRPSVRQLQVRDQDLTVFVFSLVKSDQEDSEYRFAVHFRIRTDNYVRGILRASEISVQQSLRVWVSTSGTVPTVRCKWMGEKARTPELSDGSWRIKFPSSSFSENWKDGLALSLALVREGGDDIGGGPRQGTIDRPQAGGGTMAVASEAVLASEALIASEAVRATVEQGEHARRTGDEEVEGEAEEVG